MSDEREELYLAAGRQALERFPVIAASIELFSVSENITLRVRDKQERSYALRLHRPGYNSLAELEAERCWTRALADAGIVVQAGVRSIADTEFVSVNISSLEEERHAGLTTWLPGIPLGHTLDTEGDLGVVGAAFRDIGRLAGRMHLQSRAWTPPPEFSRPRLDITGLLGEEPRWGRFWEHPNLSADDREVLRDARSVLIRLLEDYGEDADNFGLIHADLHPGNIVILDNVLSVIDFDDAAFGWFGYDLATALVEVWGTEHFAALRAALLEGYREHRSLQPRDEQMLDTFIVLRGMATIGWYGQRPEHDDLDYLKELSDRVVSACRQFINPQASAARS